MYHVFLLARLPLTSMYLSFTIRHLYSWSISPGIRSIAASTTKTTLGGPLHCDVICRAPAEADFEPPFPFAFAMEISVKSPNTETSSSDGDLAGGGVSQTDFAGAGLDVVGGRGEATRIFFGGVGVREDAADTTPPFAFGGGRVGASIVMSSSFGNVIPAGLATV